MSQNAGVRIIIHDPNVPPLPDQDGIDLHPNMATSIAITKVENSRDGFKMRHQSIFFIIES